MYLDNVIAMILAGGEGRRLDILSAKRAKPAVPFGGKYRIIDFCLSNCVHSGISCIGVLTQYNPRSLNDHIRTGKAWDLDRMNGGIFLLQPYVSDSVTDWYRGTAAAIYQNLNFVRERKPCWVLILSGDHIYTMDYRKLLDFHRDCDADLTVSVIEVPWEEAHRFGVLSVDSNGRVVEFEEKPSHPKSNLASMGIYVFSYEVLEEELEYEAQRIDTSFDFGKDIIPRIIHARRVFAFRFEGYWKDVGTLDSYWEANMELLKPHPAINLYERQWLIYTPLEDRPPVKLGREALVENSILGSGTIVNGKVINSILFNGVYVSEGAEIRESIIMDDVFIEGNACLDRVIVDKLVTVGSESHIGYGEDFTPNRKFPDMLQSGLTVIGKNTRIPPRTIIGRNCQIAPDLGWESFAVPFIPSGSSLEYREAGW